MRPTQKSLPARKAAEPGVIERRVPEYCNCCVSDLSGIAEELVCRRQVIDIPPIVPVVTEQQIYARTCTCGHTTQGTYSPNANAPVGYGENTEALVALRLIARGGFSLQA